MIEPRLYATRPILHPQEPALRHPTEARIRGFGDLQEGWHYGEGVAFDSAILDRAVALHTQAIGVGLMETAAFPGLNGEVMVTVYDSDDCLEFIIERSDTVTFTEEVGDREVRHVEGLTFKEAEARLRQHGMASCRQYGFSRWGTFMTRGSAVLSVPHSKTAEISLAFR